jgi:hypothetical protein
MNDKLNSIKITIDNLILINKKIRNSILSINKIDNFSVNYMNGFEELKDSLKKINLDNNEKKVIKDKIIELKNIIYFNKLLINEHMRFTNIIDKNIKDRNKVLIDMRV